MLSLTASLKSNHRIAGAGLQADRALVARFCAGDATAFDCIFRQNQDYVYRLCCGMLGDEAWAQDVTQEVFLRAYRSVHRFRGDATLRTWLYRITINECLQRLRRRRCEELTLPETQVACCGAVDDVFDASPKMEAVRAALRRLSPAHRAALTLRYFEEMSYEEIARVMNSSVKRIRAMLYRARESFRAAYCERPKKRLRSEAE